jgi:hypothetical protein
MMMMMMMMMIGKSWCRILRNDEPEPSGFMGSEGTNHHRLKCLLHDPESLTAGMLSAVLTCRVGLHFYSGGVRFEYELGQQKS